MSLLSVGTINSLICVLRLRVAFFFLSPTHSSPASYYPCYSEHTAPLGYPSCHAPEPHQSIAPPPPPLPFVSTATDAGDSPALLAEAVLADSARCLMEGARKEINGRADLQTLASLCSFPATPHLSPPMLLGG